MFYEKKQIYCIANGCFDAVVIADLKKYKGSKKLTQEMVDAFIQKITVYPDKRIEIEWAYTDKEKELFALQDGGEIVAG